MAPVLFSREFHPIIGLSRFKGSPSLRYVPFLLLYPGDRLCIKRVRPRIIGDRRECFVADKTVRDRFHGKLETRLAVGDTSAWPSDIKVRFRRLRPLKTPIARLRDDLIFLTSHTD